MKLKETNYQIDIYEAKCYAQEALTDYVETEDQAEKVISELCKWLDKIYANHFPLSIVTDCYDKLASCPLPLDDNFGEMVDIFKRFVRELEDFINKLEELNEAGLLSEDLKNSLDKVRI